MFISLSEAHRLTLPHGLVALRPEKRGFNWACIPPTRPPRSVHQRRWRWRRRQVGTPRQVARGRARGPPRPPPHGPPTTPAPPRRRHLRRRRRRCHPPRVGPRPPPSPPAAQRAKRGRPQVTRASKPPSRVLCEGRLSQLCVCSAAGYGQRAEERRPLCLSRRLAAAVSAPIDNSWCRSNKQQRSPSAPFVGRPAACLCQQPRTKHSPAAALSSSRAPPSAAALTRPPGLVMATAPATGSPAREHCPPTRRQMGGVLLLLVVHVATELAVAAADAVHRVDVFPHSC